MKLTQLLIIAGGCLSLSSCDPHGSEKYVIRNASSQIIYAEVGSATHLDTTYKMDPGQSVDYYLDSGVGKGDKGEAPKDDKIDAHFLYRIRRDSAVCRKEQTTYSNWNVVKQSKRIQTLTFSIADTDF